MLLELEGMMVETATNAKDGLKLAHEEKFDVILSDISMPGMDGYEFIKELRKQERNSEVLALAVTGMGRQQDIERAYAAGFSGHINKPFRFEDLLDTIIKLNKSEDEINKDL